MPRLLSFILAQSQDEYQTVAEAFRAAVVSLLKDEDMNYRRSFYYWAAFISHGFASVKLDDALLDQIHDRLIDIRTASNDHIEGGDSNNGEIKDSPLLMAILTLTQDAYHRMEKQEQTLTREWCEKWHTASS